MTKNAWLRFLAGMLAAVSGVVWTLQGFNSPLAPQSFMTGSLVWVVIGIATIIGGSLLIRSAWQNRR
jgi:uncharacterized membrane protein HdeD (DUF308 family)